MPVATLAVDVVTARRDTLLAELARRTMLKDVATVIESQSREFESKG